MRTYNCLFPLAQVRDILKGVLKPSKLSDDGRGQTHSRGHEQNCYVATPDPLISKGREDTQGGGRGGFYMGNSVEADQGRNAKEYRCMMVNVLVCCSSHIYTSV